MICSSAFWKQKCQNLKNVSQHFLSFNPYRPTLSLAGGTNRQFYCTWVIIYNKLDNYFFVSADRQAILGFCMGWEGSYSDGITLRNKDVKLLFI